MNQDYLASQYELKNRGYEICLKSFNFHILSYLTKYNNMNFESMSISIDMLFQRQSQAIVYGVFYTYKMGCRCELTRKLLDVQSTQSSNR